VADHVTENADALHFWLLLPCTAVMCRHRNIIWYKRNGTDVKFGGAERLFLRKAQFHWVSGSAIPAVIMTWVKGWS
jgi:hypothetical protein